MSTTTTDNFKTFIIYADRENILSGYTSNGFIVSPAYADTTIGNSVGSVSFTSDGGDITYDIPMFGYNPSISVNTNTIMDSMVEPFAADLIDQDNFVGIKDPSLIVSNLASVGSLQVGDVLSPPASLVGEDGDKKGMFRTEADKLWYCHTDFNPGSPTDNIWRYADLIEAPVPVVTPGMNLREMPVNYPYGTAGDKKGDIIVSSNNSDSTHTDSSPTLTSFVIPYGTFFYCIADYTTGSTPIWIHISRPCVDFGGLRRDKQYTVSSGNIITNYKEFIAQGMIGVLISATNSTFDLKNQSKMMVFSGASANQTLSILAPGWSTGGTPFNTGNGFYFIAYNNNATHTVTIVPLNSGLINGAASFTLYPGQFATVVCNAYASPMTYTVMEGKPSSYYHPVTFGATITPDCKFTTKFRIPAMTSDFTLANPINIGDSETLYIRLLQDGTGSARTITYGSKYKWPGGTAIQPSVGANKVDLLTATYDASLDILMCNMVKNFS